MARISRGVAALAVLGLLATACSGSDTASPETAEGVTTVATADNDTTVAATPAVTGLQTTTSMGVAEVDKITWGLYRDAASLDPIFAFDFPENNVLSLLCEAPLRQAADGSIGSGLADLTTPDATTLVLKVKAGATFWNGDPVTAGDVAFSLNRNRDPNLPGFYGGTYARVANIAATAADTVTITLSEPDAWLRGELASTSAWVVQQTFVEAAGADFGSPTGRTMCSGSYQLGEWSIGSPLSIVRNDNYWQSGIKPLVKQIDFVGAPDPIALSSALQSGDVNGYYAFGSLPTLAQLKQDPAVTVTPGAGYHVDVLVVTAAADSPMANVVVRRALSMAINRQGYIDEVLQGGASMPKSLAPPGAWGYARDVFEAGYAALPDMTQDIESAKALVKDLGIEGKTITLGLISEVPPMVAEAAVVQAAAEAIGLKVELRAVPADQYINLFVDPEFRKGVDAMFSVYYPNYADPAPFYGLFALPDGFQNFSGYSNPEVTRLIGEARSTADDQQRAAKVVAAQALITQDLPWIPMAFPDNTVVTSSNLTGEVASFAYMFAPWADNLGGTG